MPENGFPLTRIFPHNGRFYDFVLIREYTVRENLYSGIFYAESITKKMKFCIKVCSHILKKYKSKTIFYAVNKIITVVRKLHDLFKCGNDQQGNLELGIFCAYIKSK